jgi:abortive infection bacteriophage resistance protein
MALIPFSKPHATAAQRVAHLRAKGLIIPRPNVAARKIELVGYELLRIYFLSRRDLNSLGRPFRPGTTYQHILQLYECDMAIRNAVTAAVGQFEILFRNAISEALSAANGGHPYYDAHLFSGTTSHLDALNSFITVYSKTKDQRAKHYRERYSAPALPPIWTLKEFLTFGAASRIFRCLNSQIRTAVSRKFGVPSDIVFMNWIACFVDLRNMCAHHDRLFNRVFQKQPSSLRSAGRPTASPKTLKAVIECLDYVLISAGVSSRTTDIVENFILKSNAVTRAEAGY